MSRTLYPLFAGLLSFILCIAGGELVCRWKVERVADDPFFNIFNPSPLFTVSGGMVRFDHRDTHWHPIASFPEKKTPGTIRILAIGESAASGWPHPAKEDYAHYWEIRAIAATIPI